MAHKIPPAKIFVNRAVEIKAFEHPRQKSARRFAAALGLLNLAALALLAWYLPLALAGLAAPVAVCLLVLGIKHRLARARLHATALPVSEDNLPELHYLQNVVIRALAHPRAFDIYVANTPSSEPEWLRGRGTAALLLPAQLVAATIERQDIGQCVWLVGRMVGLHATRRLVGPLTAALLWLAKLNPLTLPAFNHYRRLTHYTADRLGLALNLSLIDAGEATMKMLAGASLHARLSFVQIEREAERHERAVFLLLHELITARPSLPRRLRALVEYCREKYPDLYADFELHRQYCQNLLPSYREVQEFSEGKEEERKILRELGKLVYELMSAAPPLNEADEISRAFHQLHRNRDAATELEGKINRLEAIRKEWETTMARITAAEQKRENAGRALESHYREIGRTAFASLRQEIAKDPTLQALFAKALQYHVVITDREHEITRLEAAGGSVLDKSRRRMEILALRNQNNSDGKRLQAAAEAVGEEFWKECADRYEHDDLEPLKLRINGVIAELERRRLELDNLHAQKRQIENQLEQEGLGTTAHPEMDVPIFITQLKNQARAANALRPRLLESLGKSYWQRETNYHPDTRGVIDQLNDLKRRLRAFEQEES